jgi:hypothetical protein
MLEIVSQVFSGNLIKVQEYLHLATKKYDQEKD